jgi:hypothetical protein
MRLGGNHSQSQYSQPGIEVRVPLNTSKRAGILGLVIGLGFGVQNLLMTWLFPLTDDTVGVLLGVYGPMFTAWAVTAFFATRRTGRFLDGLMAGAVVAFATFCVLDLVVIARNNVFLNELTARADWRNLMAGFEGSGFESLRGYINYHFVSQAPLKILTATIIGSCMGLIGGGLGHVSRRVQRISATV